jgi:hypothetical protein
LGTGPSISKQNLTPLVNEICIGMSFFYFHPQIKNIKPKYHYDAPNHPPFDFEIVKKHFEAFKQFYTNDTMFFLGHSPYKYSYLNFLKQNPHVYKKNIFHIDYSRSQLLNEINYCNPKLWDLTKFPFLARNNLYGAIQVAAYMGFNRIYLLGCDHDYLRDLSKVNNFYDPSLTNHTEHNKEFDTEWWFLQYHLRWKDFRLINEYLKKAGCKIFNATDGGMLDVFPRVRLTDVINQNM